jgi:outer membrane protein assembly factor BamB
MRLLSILIAAAVVSAGAASSPAADAAGAAQWPQWRGPKRDGKSADTGLLKQWPAGGPPLAWKATGLGKGYGSVSLAGGKIFTTGDAGDVEYVHALDMKGNKVWSKEIGKAGAVDRPGSRSTPTFDGDRLYVLAPLGEVVCLSAADGEVVWSRNLHTDFGGNWPNWGYAESPLVDGGRVVCTPGGKKGTLVALDKKTGSTLWRSEDWTDSAAYASVTAVDYGGVRQYVQLTERNVAAVRADNGKLLWKAAWPGKTAVVPDPVFHDGHVYVTSGYNVGCGLYKVTADGGKFSAEQVYQNKDMTTHHGGVVLLDGMIYGYSDGKGWTCQDFKTGKVEWKEKEKLGKGAIAYADGMFYLREEGQRGAPSVVALIEASPQGYKEKGRFTQPDRSTAAAWAHPVIAGGKLYLRDQDVLLCYDVKAK